MTNETAQEVRVQSSVSTQDTAHLTGLSVEEVVKMARKAMDQVEEDGNSKICEFSIRPVVANDADLAKDLTYEYMFRVTATEKKSW